MNKTYLKPHPHNSEPAQTDSKSIARKFNEIIKHPDSQSQLSMGTECHLGWYECPLNPTIIKKLR